MNRRQFLGAAAALPLLPRPAFSAEPAFRLRAEPVTQQVLPEGDGATQMLGFNGTMPGPELRITRGARVRVDVENGLDQGTAVHWHGIRLENAMDGVPDLTQDLIQPGATFAYSFVPPDAGTYWYHSHFMSHEQVARGMMGALIVQEDSPPDVDRDITVLISDWLMNEDGTLIEEYATRHSVAHAGHMGNFARAFLSDTTVRTGERVRWRLINTATNRIFRLTLGGITGQVVALDGMALPQPRAMGDIVLAPAQRIDIIADVHGQVTFDMQTRGEPYRLGELEPIGDVPPRSNVAIPSLEPYNLPTPAEPAQHLTLTMMGGAMGGRHGGDNIWAFNNVSDLPDAPFAEIQRGETVRLTLTNDTSFPHGIHLHGHHFFELDADGALGDLRDTTLVNPRESRDILCVFDNPGDWMIHCHMLSHSMGGMKTWVRVA